MNKTWVIFVAVIFLIAGCASHVKTYSDLIVGAQNGSVVSVETSLKSGADINGKVFPKGPTALYVAAQNGHLNVVKFLLEKGADVNEIFILINENPVKVASQNGHLEIVKLLLDNGADVNVVSSNGSTALISASQNGHSEILKLLLDKGAQVNVSDKNGYSPLHLAVRRCSTPSIEALIQHGAALNAQTIPQGATPVYFACAFGKLESLQRLLEAGANPNLSLQNGWTPIEIAAYNGHESIVETLCHYGVQQTLYTYCALNNISQVQEMVKSPEDANLSGPNGIPPLCFSVHNSRMEISQYLLDKGADPNYKTKEGFSPMFAAVASHDKGMVAFLLDNGADIGIQDGKGFIPLHRAAQMGDAAMVDFLLERGANLNATSDIGTTALYDAVLHNSPDTVQVLLKKKPDLQKGYHQWTPLHVAVQNGNIDIAKALLDNGAILNAIIPDTSQSPVDIAYVYKKTAMIQFLTEYFAQQQVTSARELFQSGEKSVAIETIDSIVRYYDDQIKELARKRAIAANLLKEDTFKKDLAYALNSALSSYAIQTGNASLIGQTAVNDLRMQGSRKPPSPEEIKINHFNQIYTTLKRKYSLMADCVKKEDATSDCLK